MNTKIETKTYTCCYSEKDVNLEMINQHWHMSIWLDHNDKYTVHDSEIILRRPFSSQSLVADIYFQLQKCFGRSKRLKLRLFLINFKFNFEKTEKTNHTMKIYFINWISVKKKKKRERERKRKSLYFCDLTDKVTVFYTSKMFQIWNLMLIYVISYVNKCIQHYFN